MTAPRSIAVVICHGLYHSAALYLNVGDINHPDINREPPSAGYPTNTEDVEIIIQLLDQLINKEEKQAKPCQAKEKSGGIIGLFYYGAFIIPVGQSVHSYFQPKEGPVIYPPFTRFSNDQTLPKEYQEQMVAQQEQKEGSFIVYHAPSGHSPHLSWTAGLVDKVTEFVNKVISL
ncbi:hypothetical protein BDV06DRAFT_216228 [Aspergillus oleicola]